MTRRMKKFLHRPQRSSSSRASPLAMSLLQYGHLISGNSLLFMMVKLLRPADYPPILHFVSPETNDRRILRKRVSFRLWGRGAALLRRAGGGGLNSPASVNLSGMYRAKRHNMSLKGL